MSEVREIKVARITGKNRPGILAVALKIAQEEHLYVQKRRGFVDYDQATVVLRLVGTSEQLSNAKAILGPRLDDLVTKQLHDAAKKRGESFDVTHIPKEEKLIATFTDACEPEYRDEDTYPYLLRIEATAPETKTPAFLRDLTADLAEHGIDILADNSDTFEPPGAPTHALACRNVLGVLVPLKIFADLEGFEESLNNLARKYGCLRVNVMVEEGA